MTRDFSDTDNKLNQYGGKVAHKSLPVMSNDAAQMSAAARLMHSFKYGDTGDVNQGDERTITPFPTIAI